MTRLDKIPSRWPCEGKDGHTNSTRTWTFAWPSGIFLHAKYFGSAHEVPAEPEKLNRWSYDDIRWHKIPSRMARWLCDQARIWTFRVSIGWQCDAGILPSLNWQFHQQIKKYRLYISAIRTRDQSKIKTKSTYTNTTFLCGHFASENSESHDISHGHLSGYQNKYYFWYNIMRLNVSCVDSSKE